MRATRSAVQRTGSSASERQLVESIFRSYGLPGWLGWGTYGAESSYGQNGEFKFGGIDLPHGNTPNLALAARESAAAYAGLVKQYGSVAAAVPHYSGNSYTIGHVEQLARGGGQGSPTVVPVSFLGNLSKHLPELFGGQGPLALGETLGEGVGKGEGLTNPLEPGLKALGGVSEFFSALLNVQTWIRVGEVLAGAVLVYLGLKGLTGFETPAVVPVPV